MKSERNYPLLLISQFLSAFGDNAILAVIIGQLTVMNRAGGITDDVLRERSALYTSLLFIPYILLAPLAGYLNDRYAKTTWLAGGNAVKLLGTAVCALSIWLGYVWQAPGYIIVGIGSCFYGPAKYGILPEILPPHRLVKANGTVELLTLTAIITGAIGGSFLVDRLSLVTCYAVLLGIFGASWGLNLLMDRTQANPGIQLSDSLQEFARATRDLVLAPRLGRVLLGTALFWICGAVMKINFQAWGIQVLHLPSNLQVSLLGLWLSVGVMAGSVYAGMRHGVGDLTWTRRYGVGLVGAVLLLWSVEPMPFWQSGSFLIGELRLIPGVIVLLVATGFIAGLFLIPLNAALQAESDPTRLGKIIAVQNLCDNIAMLLAGGLVTACVRLHLSAGQVFAVLAAVVLVVVGLLQFPPRAGVQPG